MKSLPDSSGVHHSKPIHRRGAEHTEATQRKEKEFSLRCLCVLRASAVNWFSQFDSHDLEFHPTVYLLSFRKSAGEHLSVCIECQYKLLFGSVEARLKNGITTSSRMSCASHRCRGLHESQFQMYNPSWFDITSEA